MIGKLVSVATKCLLSVLLAGLLISAPSSRAAAQLQPLTEPFVVPLEFLSGGNRLGINALIVGGTLSPPVTYLFDTGSAEFISAYGTTGTTSTQTSAWWGPPQSFTLTGSSGTTSYTGGGGYVHRAVNVAVTLAGTGGGSLTTGSSYCVSQATAHLMNGIPQAGWLAESPPSGTIPPLQGTFYGTFGADLTDPSAGLYGFINQFQTGTGVTPGFVVDATSPRPTLTLGLDQTVTSRFSAVAPLVAGTNGGFMENLVNANFTFTSATSSTSLPAIPTIFDTGTPGSMVIYTGSAMQLPPGFEPVTIGGIAVLPECTVQFSLGGANWSVSSTDVAVMPAANSVGGITLGLPFFEDYAVMYDVGSGTIGFAAAAVPEPATSAMVLAGLAGVGFSLWRRRTWM